MLNNIPAEEFLNGKVRIIFEPMIAKLLLEKPNDPYDNSEEIIHSDSDEDDTEDYDEVHDMEMQKKITEKSQGGARQRSSVCAEVYGTFNKKENFVPKVVPKTKEQYELITKRVNQSFMFSALDEKDLKTVVDAMEEKQFAKDEKVIEQGESGDVLYLIEAGNLDCFKVFSKGEEPTHLKIYGPGDSFGELALLYNSPRAATIIANEDCLLWSLDRETFNHIVKDASMKKREKYEKFLKSVEILKSIDTYEINQISDALKTRKIYAGDYIIRKDDIGEEFYILEEGEAYATKPLENSGKEETVKEYFAGDYFGELALIKNDLRAANVIAKTDCTLISLDRKSFKRLLGPVENIMNRLSNSYVK